MLDRGWRRGLAKCGQRALPILLCIVMGCSISPKRSGSEETFARPSGVPTNDQSRRLAVRIQLATAYLAEGAYRVALDEAKRAVDIDSRSADAHGLLGLIYRSLGDDQAALAAYQRAMALDPTNADVASNFGLFQCETGNYSAGIATILIGMSQPLYPRKVNLLQMAGQCAYGQGKLADAEKYLKQALDRDSGNEATLGQLFELYLRQNRLTEARAMLKTSPVASEPDAAWLFRAARIEQRAADRSSAQRFITTLLERYPESVEAARVRQGQLE